MCSLLLIRMIVLMFLSLYLLILSSYIKSRMDNINRIKDKGGRERAMRNYQEAKRRQQNRLSGGFAGSSAGSVGSGSTWSTPASSTPKYQQQASKQRGGWGYGYGFVPASNMQSSSQVARFPHQIVQLSGLAIPYGCNPPHSSHPYNRAPSSSVPSSSVPPKGVAKNVLADSSNAANAGFKPGPQESPGKKSPTKSPFTKRVKSNISKGVGYRGVSALGARLEDAADNLGDAAPPADNLGDAADNLDEDECYDEDVPPGDDQDDDEVPGLSRFDPYDSDDEEDESSSSARNPAGTRNKKWLENVCYPTSEDELVKAMKVTSQYSSGKVANTQAPTQEQLTRIHDHIADMSWGVESVRSETVKSETVKTESTKTESTKTESGESIKSWPSTNPPKSLVYHGFSYYLKYKGTKLCTYNCTSHRRGGCPANLRVNCIGNVVAGSDPHNISCYHKQCVEVPPDRQEELPSAGGNYSEEMEKYVENLCIRDTAMTATRVWKDSVKHFRELGGPNFQGLTKSQVMNLVYYTRRRVHGGDALKKVENEYSGGSKASAFLRHSSQFVDEKGAQRQMCFAAPELLRLLAYPDVSFFVKM